MPSFAQEELKIDFLNPESFPNEPLKHGKTYIFVLENVNRHLYKMEGTISQEEFNMKLPEVLKGIKLPSYLNFSLPEGEGLINAKIDKEIEAIDETNPEEEIKNALALINKSNRALKSIALLGNELTNLINSCERDTYKEVERKLIKLVNVHFEQNINSRTEQEEFIRNFLKKLIDDAIKAEGKLSINYSIYKGIISDSIESNLDLMQKWDVSPLEKNSDPKSEYAKRLDTYKNQGRKNAVYTAYLKELDETVKNAKASIVEIRKFNEENKIQLLINKYNLINKSNYTFKSKPFKVNADEVKLVITAKAEALLSCDFENEVTINRTFNVKGGLKVDFSTGVFFNGGNEDFIGRELYYSKVDDTSTMIKSKDGGSRMLLGIGGLMHIYWRTGNNLNFAISPGISTTSNFDQLNFHLGGSALFGKKNRIVVTAGLTMRETNILDKNYKFDTAYISSELPESPPSIKVFPRLGYFISLTYNFSKFESK